MQMISEMCFYHGQCYSTTYTIRNKTKDCIGTVLKRKMAGETTVIAASSNLACLTLLKQKVCEAFLQVKQT